jgi:diadenosine tetraphosphate (Ap4A) HIT family hydrolase
MSAQIPADCPFCLENNLLATPILAESEGGFLTTAHSHPGNFLVIPRVHVEAVASLPDNWMRDFKQLIVHIPGLDHYNISVNIGSSAGQTVKHLHFWIVPRREDHPAAGKGLAGLISHAEASSQKN